MTRIALVGLLLLAAGCAEVKPWERGAHAHRCLRWEPHGTGTGLRNHVLDVREGKPSVGGSAGSGCGCG